MKNRISTAEAVNKAALRVWNKAIADTITEAYKKNSNSVVRKSHKDQVEHAGTYLGVGERGPPRV